MADVSAKDGSQVGVGYVWMFMIISMYKCVLWCWCIQCCCTHFNVNICAVLSLNTSAQANKGQHIHLNLIIAEKRLS